MKKTGNARNDSVAKHIKITNDVLCDCRDIHSNKFQRSVSIRFIPAIEFICASCQKFIVAKIETPEEKIICPRCGRCEFTLTNTFNKLLEAAKRPTPNQIRGRRLRGEQNNGVGRPTLDGVPREPTQLTLHPDTIDALYELGVSRGELFEFLLNLFPPFTSIRKNKTQSGPPDTPLPT